MFRRNFKIKLLKGLLCAASLMAFTIMTACGSSKENISNEYKMINETSSDDSDVNAVENNGSVSSFEDDQAFNINIPEHYEFNIDDNSRDIHINIDADVDAARINNASVYKENIVTVTENELINIAKNVFDQGAYERCKPYAMMNKDDMKTEAINLIENTNLDKENDNDNILIECVSDIDDKLMNFWSLNGYFDQLNELMLAYDLCEREESLDFSSDSVVETVISDSKPVVMGTFAVPFDTDLATLRGRIDGKLYELVFGETTIAGEPVRRLNLRVVGKHTRAIDVYNENDITEKMIEALGGNLCDKSKAINDAEDIVKKMGYNDYSVEAIYERACTKEGQEFTVARFADQSIMPSPEHCLDGYTIFLSPRVEGINGFVSNESNVRVTITADSDKNLAFDKNGIVSRVEGDNFEGYIDVPQEVIAVEIDHNGIINVKIGALYEKTEKMTDEIQMIDFNQFENILKAYYTDGEHSGEKTTITDIKFRYASIRYDGGMVYAPVWVCYSGGTEEFEDFSYLEKEEYEYHDNTIQYDNAVLGINALDGSIVYFNEGLVLK